MTTPRRLRLYADQFDRTVLGLTIDLDGEGKVTFTPGDEAAAAFLMNLVGSAVPRSTRSTEFVTPADGAAYLDAVAGMLSRTSRWLVSEEDVADSATEAKSGEP